MDAPVTADMLHMCRSIHILGKGDVTLHVTLLWVGPYEDCNEHKLRSSLSAVGLEDCALKTLNTSWSRALSNCTSDSFVTPDSLIE